MLSSITQLDLLYQNMKSAERQIITAGETAKGMAEFDAKAFAMNYNQETDTETLDAEKERIDAATEGNLRRLRESTSSTANNIIQQMKDVAQELATAGVQSKNANAIDTLLKRDSMSLEEFRAYKARFSDDYPAMRILLEQLTKMSGSPELECIR